jgi:hypothetical protein
VEKALETAFAELDNVLKLKQKGATKEALEAYLATKQQDANAENTAVAAAAEQGTQIKREKSAPGPATRAYVAEVPELVFLIDTVEVLVQKKKVFWDSPEIQDRYDKLIKTLRQIAVKLLLEDPDASTSLGGLEALKTLPDVVRATQLAAKTPEEALQGFEAEAREKKAEAARQKKAEAAAKKAEAAAKKAEAAAQKKGGTRHKYAIKGRYATRKA